MRLVYFVQYLDSVIPYTCPERLQWKSDVLQALTKSMLGMQKLVSSSELINLPLCQILYSSFTCHSGQQ